MLEKPRNEMRDRMLTELAADVAQANAIPLLARAPAQRIRRSGIKSSRKSLRTNEVIVGLRRHRYQKAGIQVRCLVLELGAEESQIIAEIRPVADVRLRLHQRDSVLGRGREAMHLSERDGGILVSFKLEQGTAASVLRVNKVRLKGDHLVEAGKGLIRAVEPG